MSAVVVIHTTSVERLLAAAHFAVSIPSMVSWLGGPVTKILQERAQERFWGQGQDISPRGGWNDWPELKDSTISFRASQGFGPTPINIRTGELEQYITESPGNVAPTGVGATLKYPGPSPSGVLAKKVKAAQAGKKGTTPARGAGGKFTGGSVTTSDKTARATPPRPVLGLGVPDVEMTLVSLNMWLVQAISTGAAS